MHSADIRKQFLQWFADRGHAILPSSSVVPERDPTLFFTNAGMVQFKDYFTGAEASPVSRATTVQKCMRVSGKHNDLENVGRTPRHHTLFEMLGNFSFGDYFKEDAIPFAWELLTQGFGLDPNRLWVTIYEDDDEAAELWTRKVGFPKERLQRLGAKDNFWSMGDTGPCGPCTEIHWDHGPSVSSELGGPATEDDRYVEIWNLVFMQYNQAADGTRTNLPRPSIDTGMGLERLAAIKQGVYSNYDTDLFQPIIQRTAKLAGVRYNADHDTDVALRVIADHARAGAFLVADGVMPSNGDRGYVLRRVLRRAIRYGVKLGLKEPFLFQAADTVIHEMGDAYPELKERRDFILEVLKGEEERFSETLERGLTLLEKEFDGLESKGADTLPGEVVFKLYDTFGFPVDLTRLIADERKITLDEEGYKTSMEAQRAASRKSWKGSGEAAVPELERALAETSGATEFLGFSGDSGESTVLALVKQPEGSEDKSPEESVGSLSPGAKGRLAVKATPFYAESGGQVGDTGTVSWKGGHARVLDTQKGHGDIVYHHIEVAEGSPLSVGAQVQLQVAGADRDRTRLNHTATHLMHAALKQVLGDHVAQKGSLVGPNRLRFDFAHHKPMTPEELQQVEDLVYGQILTNTGVTTEVKDLEQARADGAMALFGEKYGDRVRVVSVPGFSVELCGGTHAKATGDIGLFRVVSEAGVAAGVRRIEALTGQGALQWTRKRDHAAAQAAARLRTPVEELDQAIDRQLSERRRLERELDALRQELARMSAGDLAAEAREVDGIKVIAAEVPGDASTLRTEADRLRDQLGSGVVVLGSRSEGSVLLVAAVTKDLAGKRVHAGKLIGKVAKQVGGGGGGRPDMAQAGGKKPDGLPAALESVYALVAG